MSCPEKILNVENPLILMILVTLKIYPLILTQSTCVLWKFLELNCCSSERSQWSSFLNWYKPLTVLGPSKFAPFLFPVQFTVIKLLFSLFAILCLNFINFPKLNYYSCIQFPFLEAQFTFLRFLDTLLRFFFCMDLNFSVI